MTQTQKNGAITVAMLLFFGALGLSTLGCSGKNDYAEVTAMPGLNGTNGIDGVNGQNGLPGVAGPMGPAGPAGAAGSDGRKPGLICNVHDLKDWNGDTTLPTILAKNPAVGSFVLANLSVGDTPSANGFPGMPKGLQDKVGLEGYALDCFGYLNIDTSGIHQFRLFSDDGSRLVIEDVVVIQNQGLHSPTTVTAKVDLHKGLNRINVTYFQGPNHQIALELRASGPNTSEAVIPSTSFSYSN